METSPFAPVEFTVEFLNGNSLVESISWVVYGDAGARLFAREDGAIDRGVITSETDFAIAQVRYQLVGCDQTFAIVLALLLLVILALILL